MSSPNGNAPTSGRIEDVRDALRRTADVFGEPGTDDVDPLFGGENPLAPPAPTPPARPSYAQQAAQAPSATKVEQPAKRAAGPEGPGRRPAVVLAAVAAGVIAVVAALAFGVGQVLQTEPADAEQATRLVLQGDSLMAAGAYAEAREPFMEVLRLQPENPYVQQRLTQIDRLETAEARMEAPDADVQFARLVAEGDSLSNLVGVIGEPALVAQVQEAAREAYLRALVYRPDDATLRQRLVELAPDDADGGSDLEAGRAELQRERLEQYRSAVEEGDRRLASGDYLDAQLMFKEALLYQPDDAYAAGRLELIDSLWKEANQKEKYDAYLRQGDDLLQANLYSQAREAYQEALAIMPGDSTAQQRIAESQRIEDEARQEREAELAREQQYQTLLREGDLLLAQGRHEEALAHFAQALESFSEDPVFTERMRVAQTYLNKEKQVDENGVYLYLADGEQPQLLTPMRELYSRIRYPRSALRDQLEGRVIVEFVVDERGRVENPRILKGLSRDCDREVLRVIKTAEFEPARVDGRAVKALQTYPVTFKISQAQTGD